MDLVEVKDHTQLANYVSDLFDYKIQDLITEYKGNSYGLAKVLCDDLMAAGWLVSIITFASNNGPLTLLDEYSGKHYKEYKHSVVCFGTWVIDPLNSMLVFTIPEYVDVLKETNKDLRLVKKKSFWWTIQGEKVYMNLKKMMNYKGLG